MGSTYLHSSQPVTILDPRNWVFRLCIHQEYIAFTCITVNPRWARLPELHVSICTSAPLKGWATLSPTPQLLRLTPAGTGKADLQLGSKSRWLYSLSFCQNNTRIITVPASASAAWQQSKSTDARSSTGPRQTRNHTNLQPYHDSTSFSSLSPLSTRLQNIDGSQRLRVLENLKG